MHVYNRRFLLASLPDGTYIVQFHPHVTDPYCTGVLSRFDESVNGPTTHFGGVTYEEVFKAVEDHVVAQGGVGLIYRIP